MFRRLVRGIPTQVKRYFWKGTRYTDTHESITVMPDGNVRVGVTEYALDQMGELTYLEYHSGTHEPDESLADLETTKATYDIKIPGKFTVENGQQHTAVNLATRESDRWIVEGKLHDDITNKTMSSEEYLKRLNHDS